MFDGEKDVTSHFDLSRARRPGHEQRRVNIDFPSWIIESLDAHASPLGEKHPNEHAPIPSRTPIARQIGLFDDQHLQIAVRTGGTKSPDDSCRDWTVQRASEENSDAHWKDLDSRDVTPMRLVAPHGRSCEPRALIQYG